MKQLFSRVLVVLILLISTDLYQFAKLPVLLQHYGNHMQVNQHLGIFDFLHQHYTDASANSDAQSLPYLNDDCDTGMTLQNGLQPGDNADSRPIMNSYVYSCIRPCLHPQTVFSKIFEPPRNTTDKL